MNLEVRCREHLADSGNRRGHLELSTPGTCAIAEERLDGLVEVVGWEVRSRRDWEACERVIGCVPLLDEVNIIFDYIFS